MRALLVFLVFGAFFLASCAPSTHTGNVVGGEEPPEIPEEPSLEELRQERLMIVNELAGVQDQRADLEIEFWRRDTTQERKESLRQILDGLNAEEYRLEQELIRIDSLILQKRSS